MRTKLKENPYISFVSHAKELIMQSGEYNTLDDTIAYLMELVLAMPIDAYIDVRNDIEDQYPTLKYTKNNAEHTRFIHKSRIQGVIYCCKTFGGN
eukprot:TRINITY_DN4748_c0_g1_i1.p1 TRINITY_DN4748_c0_g1~~TRINITY_DN4748_c0_g1_i1.p1  ORF type:complete len:95 (-),score=11.24 TRINITY_DN4748_c0_g1_i1:119-403(-)